MAKTYRILYLCADLLDFDGTRGDMLYFLSRLKAYDIAYEYVEHQLSEKIDVRTFDFIYAGVCPQKYEDLYLSHLQTNIVGLKEYIEAGKLMLAIEQSFLFLAQQIVRTDETKTALLGILPMQVKELDHYAIGNILWESEIADFASKINGFINTRYRFDLTDEEKETLQPLGSIRLGIDFLWQRGFEGVRYKNFFGTQLRGPILPRNYDFADYFIQRMIDNQNLPTLDATLEAAAKAKLTADCEAFIASGEQKKEYVYVS